ncbi:hypothetical protein B0I08_105224 [Glaciihabitans tibetensis]|uniref:Uncharacterized protein n=1 Tax=Glaciihabitans tibetensis TaxID=1266600 RepID=A0A2T0VD09_9MICO|nr:hypothetical protein [Glaciihabitans tibetensis]PRY68059.1 hypothetical protein B0I08_105224 [Glaciihabitans tibetensis]
MLSPLNASGWAISAVGALVNRLRGGRDLPPDPFGLPPVPPSPEVDRTRREIENTTPRNFGIG